MNILTEIEKAAGVLATLPGRILVIAEQVQAFEQALGIQPAQTTSASTGPKVPLPVSSGGVVVDPSGALQPTVLARTD